MNRKEEIAKILSNFEGVRLVAFENQELFMDSIISQFEQNGDLSDKQISVAKAIIEQCSNYSRSFRASFSNYN